MLFIKLRPPPSFSFQPGTASTRKSAFNFESSTAKISDIPHNRKRLKRSPWVIDVPSKKTGTEVGTANQNRSQPKPYAQFCIPELPGWNQCICIGKLRTQGFCTISFF